MKIYNENVYLVLEVKQAQFDSITDHLTSDTTDTIKYLLANRVEINYLSEQLDLDKMWLQGSDYFKVTLA